MSGATPELNLATAVDSDDNADYLTLSLANSLRTVDALFNNLTGHKHSGAHQGGVVVPAAGSITSTMIADGTIATADIGAGQITTALLAGNAATQVGVANSDGSTYTRTPTFSPVILPGVPAVSLTFNFTGPILVWGSVYWSHSVSTAAAGFGFSVDGATPGLYTAENNGTAPAGRLTTFFAFFNPMAGVHTFQLGWDNQSAGTITRGSWWSQIAVVEFRR